MSADVQLRLARLLCAGSELNCLHFRLRSSFAPLLSTCHSPSHVLSVRALDHLDLDSSQTEDIFLALFARFPRSPFRALLVHAVHARCPRLARRLVVLLDSRQVLSLVALFGRRPISCKRSVRRLLRTWYERSLSDSQLEDALLFAKFKSINP